MSELLTLPGLDQSLLGLLEAVGLRDLKDLAEANEQNLAGELERANRILNVVESSPDYDTVVGWVRQAREHTGTAAEEPVIVCVNYEKNAKIMAMLRSSPFAIPLPGNALKEKGLSVPDIPSGFLLNEYPGDFDIRVEKKIPKARTDAPSHSPYIQVSEQVSQSKQDIDLSRLKSTSLLGPLRARVHASPEPGTVGRVPLIRAPKASTNAGRNPNSRSYIRGVLHTNPLAIYLGAFLTLVLMILVPSAVAATLLLMLSREKPAIFGWVDERWLAVPFALPIVGLAWVILGFSGVCRVCGQKLFLHRLHRKNAKAHYIPGLGYVVPLCVHIVLFRWFRCPHCGTPVRLKK